MHWLDCPTAGDDAPRVVSPGPAPGERCTLPAADRAGLSPDRTLLARVAAFCIIIAGIIGKNLPGSR